MREWRWISHTLRKEAESTDKQTLHWNPQGTRRRGRPKQTWKRAFYRKQENVAKYASKVKRLAGNTDVDAV
jgi:hypothetical protein